MSSLKGQVILVTGGTGSFGKKFVEMVLADYDPKKLIIFSRDELKQHEMRVAGFDDPRLRYFIGDVRDGERLRLALKDVDVVVHAAALKQVPACEYNPFEAVMTNVLSARHIVTAALDHGVKKVMALSTDKACNPSNLYGATKLVAEKAFIHANVYTGSSSPTKFSCVRYGNVVGSRGSVIPLFLKQKETGSLTITDDRMTRFFLTLEQAVNFVIKAIDDMEGGEIFVPKIPSAKIIDIAKQIAPECEIKSVGIRAGEKLHEALLTEHEAHFTLEQNDRYVIWPDVGGFSEPISLVDRHEGELVQERFEYRSDNNTSWLSSEELQKHIDDVKED